ncbi:MAG TPA: branched-chain amino acid ABC transporter permease [Azospirillum sp.]|nr:branched-chain amino acid ABC transporter permease [Azospirillum sp.]
MSVEVFLNLVLNGVFEGVIIALGALGLTLVFGVARFPNAAAGDVMTIGAYAALGVQALAGGLAGGLVFMGGAAMAASALVAVAAHLAIFRKLAGRTAVALLVASIGLAFLLRCLIMLAVGHDQKVFAMPILRAIPIGPVRVAPTDLWILAAAAVLLAGSFALLHLTPIGRKMRAVADNPALARASGIDVDRVMLAMWVIFGALSGAAGLLLGVKTVVTPEMGWDLLLPAFAATILGSIGNPVGAVVGGVLMGVAQEVSTPFVGFTYKIGVGFLVMVLILLVRPQGLFARDADVR